MSFVEPLFVNVFFVASVDISRFDPKKEAFFRLIEVPTVDNFALLDEEALSNTRSLVTSGLPDNFMFPEGVYRKTTPPAATIALSNDASSILEVTKTASPDKASEKECSPT